jgi:hypothetical protein
LGARSRLLRWLSLGVGLLLCLIYVVWQASEPHGPGEFAYAFTLNLPYSAMRGFTYEQLWGHVRRVCLLAPGLSLTAWGLAGLLELRPPRDLQRAMWCCSAWCLLVTGVIMLGVFRGRAFVNDELIYAMQAGFYRAGRLTGVDLGISPGDLFTVVTGLGYTGKYLPGEGLMQVPGVMLGVPALMHLPVVAITLWAFYQAVRRSSGVAFAQLATAALALSPMLAFTSATGLSHASTLMWVVLMGLAVELAKEGRVLSGAVLSGASFGLGLLTRPQSLLPAGAVLGLALVWVLLKRRALAALATLALVSGAGAALLLAYNQALSGSPWHLPWFLQCDAEHYGFGFVWATQTYEHTLRGAFENLLVVATRLNAWWLGLPLSLGVAAVWLAWGRPKAGAGLWLWTGAAVLLFEFFYYSPGISDIGAIYHYELLLPGSVIAAAVATRLLQLKQGPLILAVALLGGTGSWVVEQGLRCHRLISTIHRDTDAVLAKVQKPALIIHETFVNEVVSSGWIAPGTFPRQAREPTDDVVTWPRVNPTVLDRARRAYPGRHCYYYRYLPGTAKPELTRCEDSIALLKRNAAEQDIRTPPFLTHPTAYYETDYLPVLETEARVRRTADGQARVACCRLRGSLAWGEVLKPSVLENCIETGDGPR